MLREVFEYGSRQLEAREPQALRVGKGREQVHLAAAQQIDGDRSLQVQRASCSVTRFARLGEPHTARQIAGEVNDNRLSVDEAGVECGRHGC